MNEQCTPYSQGHRLGLFEGLNQIRVDHDAVVMDGD